MFCEGCSDKWLEYEILLPFMCSCVEYKAMTIIISVALSDHSLPHVSPLHHSSWCMCTHHYHYVHNQYLVSINMRLVQATTRTGCTAALTLVVFSLSLLTASSSLLTSSVQLR